MLYSIAVFAPLLGALIAGLFGRLIGDRAAQGVSIGLMIVASVCGIASFVHLVYQGAPPGVISLGSWVEAGTFHTNWALRYDTLSAVMVAMVTTVAMLIHLYSVGYMGSDETKWKFFSYLSLFSFAMLMLVTADNLLQLFFGWEGVGLASYLLIGYWYDRPSAQAAAIKAFVVNRVADLFFAVGIALVFLVFGSLDFATIFAAIPQHQDDIYHVLGGTFRVYEVIGILLFIGAAGKSAQIGLHVWLPDAMEGPTPVSALIHAATMVTAGVFLMARMSPLLEFAPFALGVVCFIGATTAFFAATIGCVQNDIKRVIAYSTCSQLGYMFIGAGVGAFQTSIFHLLTHAFFKSLLFLSAGSVIHAVSGEQDMRKMGGLARKIPFTCAAMWIGSLALAGIIPFAGYYSKDAILEAAFASGTLIGQYGFWLGVIAAFLTAFYSWRLLIMTFHSSSRMDPHAADHVHESPPVMLVPLALLSIGAISLGFLFHSQLIGPDWQAFWGASIFNAPDNHVLHDMEELPFVVGLLPLVAGLGGIGVAFWFYLLHPELPAQLAARFSVLYRFLLNKWYFDEVYWRFIITPAMRLAERLWTVGDTTIIDGMPNGVASLAASGSARVVKLQTGSIAVYAFAMLIGLVALVSIFLILR